MTNGNVLGFLAAPDREISLFAISKALLNVRTTGKTFKEIAKALDCSTDTISTAVAETNLLGFEQVARLCYFWPEEARPVMELWNRAPTQLTVDDRIERIERELAAIRREAA